MGCFTHHKNSLPGVFHPADKKGEQKVAVEQLAWLGGEGLILSPSWNHYSPSNLAMLGVPDLCFMGSAGARTLSQAHSLHQWKFETQ